MNEQSQSALVSAHHLISKDHNYLDEKRWQEWLDLFHSDCEYWVPAWISEEELVTDHQTQLSHIYYNSRAGLEDRVARILSRKSPASVPLRRTTHMSANIVIEEVSKQGEIQAKNSWTCHVFDPRSKKTFMLFGSSQYTWRQHKDNWQITKKKTIIQNDYLPSMVDIYCI